MGFELADFMLFRSLACFCFRAISRSMSPRPDCLCPCSCLLAGQSGLIEVTLSRAMCLEEYGDLKVGML
jgi:hypothetical protein